MKVFQEQISGWDREAGIMLLLAIVLMVLFAYQGHPDFLLANFGDIPIVSTHPDFTSQLYRFVFTFTIFFLIPVVIIKGVFRKQLGEFGLTAGDHHFGIKFVVMSVLVLPLPLYLTTSNPDFLQEYPLWKDVGTSIGNYFLWISLYLLYYIGWEFFFRGFMQFSLIDRIAPFYIIMMQTLPSTLIHIGKPEGETIAAILGGIIFGAVALRTRSILYPLLVHWYIGALTELFCFLHQLG
jgi:membrane protease YdiL (CAAX protease family)